MKLISFFRGNKVNYKIAFKETKDRLETVAKERDNYSKELNNIKFEIESIKNQYEKLVVKYKELKKSNKELLQELSMKDTDLNTAANIITELNKALSKEKKKPRKSVKNYSIKTERELF